MLTVGGTPSAGDPAAVGAPFAVGSDPAPTGGPAGAGPGEVSAGPAAPFPAVRAGLSARRTFGQMTRLAVSQRAHTHSESPGAFHSAPPQRPQRAQPSVHAHPSNRVEVSGHPRPRHCAHAGSTPSASRGQTMAHLPQSLQSSETTSNGVPSGGPGLMAPRGQAATQIPQPSQLGPTLKLIASPPRHRHPGPIPEKSGPKVS